MLNTLSGKDSHIGDNQFFYIAYWIDKEGASALNVCVHFALLSLCYYERPINGKTIGRRSEIKAGEKESQENTLEANNYSFLDHKFDLKPLQIKPPNITKLFFVLDGVRKGKHLCQVFTTVIVPVGEFLLRFLPGDHTGIKEIR